MAEFPKFSRIRKIGAEEHDGDVRFKSESGNMAVSCMRNASNHNCTNSSVIVGQIPRSTERISSYINFYRAAWNADAV